MEKVFNLVILDASGSMGIIRKAAHKGLNDTIKQLKSLQKEFQEREQCLTLIVFNTESIEFLYKNKPISEVAPLPYGAYQPVGATPLYDAIGRGILEVKKVARPEETVMVTIITDGEENSSRVYNRTKIKILIHQCKQLGWEFTFIGTEGLDVSTISHSIGITQNIVFRQSDEGTAKMFEERFDAVRASNMRLRDRAK